VVNMLKLPYSSPIVSCYSKLMVATKTDNDTVKFDVESCFVYMRAQLSSHRILVIFFGSVHKFVLDKLLGDSSRTVPSSAHALARYSR
jgi:hypothetical protein